MEDEIKGAIIGVISTIILYFIPVLNGIAPLLGGGIGGYSVGKGVSSGIKVGIIMALIMVLPGFFLAGILGSIFNDIPLLGEAVAGASIIITIVIVFHTAILGTIGAIIGGLVGGNKEL